MAAPADRYCNSATTWRPILARRLRDEGCEAARVPRAAEVENVDEPKVLGPLDVVVRIGAAGLCRTDLHVQEGQWAEKSQVELPYTPGHENAGWVHELGSAVTNVEVGDTVIVHPFISCGLRGACRAGDDMHCLNGSFPGIKPRRRVRGLPADERRSLVARLRLSRELFGDVLADDFYVSRIDVLPTRGGAGTVRRSSTSTCGRGWRAAVGDSRSPRPREMTLR